MQANKKSSKTEGLDVLYWRQTLGKSLKIRVTPKASRERIVLETQPDGTQKIRVYVTCVAEDGKANEAVLALLAKELGLAKGALSISQGSTGRDKVIRVDENSY